MKGWTTLLNGVKKTIDRNNMKLIEKIKHRKIKIGVIGLGYVGLSLAVEFARAGIPTVGIDISLKK